MDKNLDQAVEDGTVHPVHVMLSVALALEQITRHRRIHRDLNPRNILVRMSPKDLPPVKLTCFGTAGLVDSLDQQHTEMERRSDVHSFGMTGLQFFRRFRLHEDFKQLMLECVQRIPENRPSIEVVC